VGGYHKEGTTRVKREALNRLGRGSSVRICVGLR